MSETVHIGRDREVLGRVLVHPTLDCLHEFALADRAVLEQTRVQCAHFLDELLGGSPQVLGEAQLVVHGIVKVLPSDVTRLVLRRKFAQFQVRHDASDDADEDAGARRARDDGAFVRGADRFR